MNVAPATASILGKWALRLTGRHPGRLRHAVSHPGHIFRSLKGLLAFRDSWSLLWCYLKRTNPSTLAVRTRSGREIRLTGDNDDFVTVLLVFGRRDYGDIPAGGVVVDIGAHLGAFTLYAMAEGADRVYAFEPDPLLCRTLRENVAANGFSRHVIVTEAAVVGQPTAAVRFEREENASGHVARSMEHSNAAGAPASTIAVRALTLSEILAEHGISCVDLLKIDCEGSEYDIIFAEAPAAWTRVRQVRLEYHLGRADELKSKLRDLGFEIIFESQTSDLVGMLACARRSLPGSV
jgi:FkbM family methyltransferase